MRKLVIALGSVIALNSMAVFAADEDAAVGLLRKSKCLNCHAVESKKDGPAYREVAAKYRGKAEAEEKLVKHITVPNKVKIDGREEPHQMVKSKDPEEIRNLVSWILSL
ncbi:c-type cytochrome [Aromatoleum toluclasticum]|uniref:c-type cytochrome n=1 Tax=Aromatoleum toluclasticum TaxID=92003 RepID=UPI00037FCD34|nr:c-type cytochrome [Aromatoleum toluclasticum]MCC4118590.1 c-type cytochrome [Aromatoleum toluclasticum]